MLIFWLLLAVPSAAPKITSAYNTSSTSISVNWTPIADNFTNGILLSYKIKYIPFRRRILPAVITTNASAASAELKGLKKFVHYLIIVNGYTKSGDGPETEVKCRTGEDGKDCPN